MPKSLGLWWKRVPGKRPVQSTNAALTKEHNDTSLSAAADDEC
jgi:hypothetical protein